MIDDIRECSETILKNCCVPEDGLPQDVFLMISALVPIVNVDLLILNEKSEILLSWRDDKFYGQGWSLVGGCIRYGESFEERIHKTARSELGTDVNIVSDLLKTANVRRKHMENLAYPRMRGHHVALLFECNPTSCFDGWYMKKEKYEAGDLRWFRKIPTNILKVHHSYDDIFSKYSLL